jgi:hypothetical protein
MKTKKPFWILIAINSCLGVIGFLLSENLTNQRPFAICFGIAILLTIGKEICHHVAVKFESDEFREALRVRRKNL